jgi:hypothetical protein
MLGATYIQDSLDQSCVELGMRGSLDKMFGMRAHQ